MLHLLMCHRSLRVAFLKLVDPAVWMSILKLNNLKFKWQQSRKLKQKSSIIWFFFLQKTSFLHNLNVDIYFSAHCALEYLTSERGSWWLLCCVEWVIFQVYHGEIKLILWNDSDVHFVLDQQLTHYVIPRQAVFAIYYQWCVLSVKETHINVISLIWPDRPGIEITIFNTRGHWANHYLTDASTIKMIKLKRLESQFI